MLKRLVWFLMYLILLTACSPLTEQATPTVTISETISDLAEPAATQRHDAIETNEETETAVTPSQEQPVTATNHPPPINPRQQDDNRYNINFLLPFDGIRPIYEPVFVVANEAPYQDDELVMGIAFENEAKAYPVTVLSFREMVNDELAGIPILVTW